MSENASLFQRLGGYNVISAVADDLVARVMADPQLGRFWAHRGEDGLRREKQHFINYVSEKTGGSLYYLGRDMALVHKGMKISEGDWIIFQGHMRATLEALKVAEPEKKELFAFLDSHRGTMVETA